MGNLYSNEPDCDEDYSDPTRELEVILTVGDEEMIVLPIRNHDPVNWDDDDYDVDLWCMTYTVMFAHLHSE